MIQLIQEIRDRGDLHLIALLAPAARRGRVLRRGADPQGRQRIAAFCNLEEERRANRRFLELETRGGNNGTFWPPSKAGLRDRSRPQRPHQTGDARGLEVRQLYEIAAGRTCRSAASITSAIRWKIFS
jgi:hypothetical protein